MNVRYTIAGESYSLQIAGDDLPVLMSTIEAQVRERHQAAAVNPELPILIADGLLNSLADDAESIDLGELAQAA